MRILRFNMNNAEYFLELKNNKLVKGKEIDKEITYNISDDEIKIMNYIFNSIITI